jgi:hypothetical protein
MPRSHARAPQALLLATALVGLVAPATPAAASPTASLATTAVAGSVGRADAARGFRYQIWHSRSDDEAIAHGEWDWSRRRVTGEGWLVDRADGYASVNFEHTLADGTKVNKSMTAEDQRVSTNYVVEGQVVEIVLSVCKEGGARATTCRQVTFMRGGRQ